MSKCVFNTVTLSEILVLLNGDMYDFRWLIFNVS